MTIRTLLKVANLGLYMHPAAIFFGLYGVGSLTLAFQGGKVIGVLTCITGSLICFAFASLLEYATIYQNLYERGYLRILQSLVRHGWSDRMARTQMMTPCQRRALLLAATDAGFRAEAMAFLENHRLKRGWSHRARAFAFRRRLLAPFELPR